MSGVWIIRGHLVALHFFTMVFYKPKELKENDLKMTFVKLSHCMSYVCHAFAFVRCSLVVTCWERADLLALVCANI